MFNLIYKLVKALFNNNNDKWNYLILLLICQGIARNL